MNEKLLTIEEVARHLGLSEKAVEELVKSGELPAYRIGGSLLRFKKEQLEIYRKRRNSGAMARGQLSPERRQSIKTSDSAKYSFWEKLEDFLYYNDFYILSLILLILIVLVVFDF